MATNLSNNTNTVRGQNSGRKVHFDGNLILKQRESGLCGSAWRKQQKEQRRQKKMAEESAAAEKEKTQEMFEMTHAYNVLKDGCKEIRLLDAVARCKRLANALNSLLNAAGFDREECVNIKEKLQWFRRKYGNRVLEEKFLDKNGVFECLFYICRNIEFRREFCFVSDPDPSSSESESPPSVFSAEKRRALQQGTHPCGQIMVEAMPYAFADSSSSGDFSIPGANATNTSSAAAPHAATTQIQGMDDTKKTYCYQIIV